MRKATIILAFSIIGLVILGCGPIGDLIATSTPIPTNTPTPTPPPTPTPMPTPTPTPPLEARLGVPVSNGQWQVIVRDVSEPDNVRQGTTRWRPGARHKYVAVESHFHRLSPGPSSLEEDDAILWEAGGGKEDSGGFGASDEYCPGCDGVGFLMAREGLSGDFGYLFHVDDSWEIDELSFEFLDLPEVALVEPEWMPDTHIPLSGDPAPPDWGVPVEMPAAGKLTYASGHDRGEVALWTVDGDGQRQRRIEFGDMAHGWAKYSPDGQRLLVLTQPRVGWMSLHLTNSDGSVSYPLVLNAEWIEAMFSGDGQHLFFSVVPIDGKEEKLYVADVDGTNVKEVTSDHALEFAVGSSGHVGLVTSEFENFPIIIAQDSNGSFRVWPDEDLASETLYLIDPEGEEVNRIAWGSDFIKAYPGDRMLLTTEFSSGSMERFALWDIDAGEDTLIHDDGTAGWGCIASDDSWALTATNIKIGDETTPRVLLVPTDDVDDQQELLSDADLSTGFRACSCQFSADGQYLLVVMNVSARGGGSTRTLFIMDLDGEVLAEVEDVENAMFSPDGTRLAYSVAAGETVYDLYLADADGSNEQHVGQGLLTGWAGAP